MQPKTKIIIGVSIAATVLTVGLWYFILKSKKKSSRQKKSAIIANQEYNTWGKGSIKEGNSKTMQRLRDYWKRGAGVTNSDSWYINTAWSAAFISWVMRMAGYDEFKRASSHSVYIRDSINNRKKNLTGFKGYKPNEVKVEVGDLVCYPRQSGVTYDTTGSYQSHCDIVVAVQDGVAATIGGNVSNSVSRTDVPLQNGKIDLSKKPKYFVVVKPPK